MPVGALGSVPQRCLLPRKYTEGSATNPLNNHSDFQLSNVTGYSFSASKGTVNPRICFLLAIWLLRYPSSTSSSKSCTRSKATSYSLRSAAIVALLVGSALNFVTLLAVFIDRYGSNAPKHLTAWTSIVVR